MIKLFTDLVILRYFLIWWFTYFCSLLSTFILLENRKTTTLECIHYHAM